MPAKFELINENIGAYVHIAADEVLQDGVPEQLSEGLEKYNVLVFPQVSMSDETFAAMTARMGPAHDLNVTAEEGTEETAAGIYRVTKEKSNQTQLDFVRGNDFWHMDGTVYDTPGKATLLKCEVPPSEGGDTGFASLHAAYDALPKSRKEKLEGLKVRHAFRAVGRRLYDEVTDEQTAEWDSFFPPITHKLIWHQKCGRTSMVIGGTGYDIEGMPHEEGRALLKELDEFATQDDFTYRHKWQKGDLVIFNNPALLHKSYPYDRESGRMMHRTTITGSEAIA
jgi:alpha-ketoglutarate-dependent taurine dioxygenase